MLDVEREEPELAAVIDATYRGRRVRSVRELAHRIVDSPHRVDGWSVDAIVDALAILTSIESYETLARAGRTPHQAARRLFDMTAAFLRAEVPISRRKRRG